MRDSSETLQVGDRAPEFSLQAANRPERFSLGQLTSRGPAIVEFLRGTW